MANFDFRTENGKLVVRKSPGGALVWSGEFGAPVMQVVTGLSIEGCLVLLDAGATKPPTFENLLLVSPDGEVRWRAQLPQTHDAVSEIVERQGKLEAKTWLGFKVEVDLATGRASEIGFFK